MSVFVFDSGAFIALERDHRLVRAIVDRAARGHGSIVTSSAVVAQVWRSGRRQARIARTLRLGAVTERPLDRPTARQIGVLAARLGASDVVDGHVALLAGTADHVVTSDRADLARWGVAAGSIVDC